MTGLIKDVCVVVRGIAFNANQKFWLEHCSYAGARSHSAGMPRWLIGSPFHARCVCLCMPLCALLTRSSKHTFTIVGCSAPEGLQADSDISHTGC